MSREGFQEIKPNPYILNGQQHPNCSAPIPDIRKSHTEIQLENPRIVCVDISALLKH